MQTHLGWFWRWAMVVVASGLLIGAVWFAYRLSQSFGHVARPDLEATIEQMKEQLETLEADNARLRAEVTAGERQLQIEGAMRADITRQLKGLTEDAAKARDETVVLQALLAQGGKAPVVSISRFRVQREGDDNSYRYRLTLLHPATGGKEFQGQLRLVANVIQDGKPLALALPEAAGEALPPTALSFKLFQPVEGTFRVPGNATLRSLEVRVFENGTAQPRATQTALVS